MLSNFQVEDVILLCAGDGTRISPITHDSIPKCLINVAGKPLLAYSLDNLCPDRIGRVVVVVNPFAGQIQQWLASAGLPFQYRIAFQTEPGIFGAVSAGLEYVESSTFWILNTDEIRIGFDPAKLLRFHNTHASSATILTTYSTNICGYRTFTIRAGDNLVMTTRIEPSKNPDRPSALRNAGALLLNYDAISMFDATRGKGWEGILDALCEKYKLRAYIDPDLVYFNINTPEEYTEAQHTLST